jgi:hypothetical protein
MTQSADLWPCCQCRDGSEWEPGPLDGAYAKTLLCDSDRPLVVVGQGDTCKTLKPGDSLMEL